MTVPATRTKVDLIPPALVVIEQDVVLQEIRASAAALKLRAVQYVIRPGTRAEASAFLIELANVRKRAEDRRKAITKPHNDYKRKVDRIFEDACAPVLEGEGIMRDKLRDFIRQEDTDRAEADAAARRATLKAEALAGQAGAAELAGEAVAEQLLEEAVEAEREAQQLQTFVAAAGPVERLVRTEVGTVGAKKVWTFAVLNLAEVPEAYLKPREVNGVAVRAAIAAGIRDVEGGAPAIAGIRIYEDDQLQVKPS